MNKDLREAFTNWSNNVVLILQALASGSTPTRKMCDDLRESQGRLDKLLGERLGDERSK